MPSALKRKKGNHKAKTAKEWQQRLWLFAAGKKFGRGEKPAKGSEWNRIVECIHSCSGVARPGPTRACALPSTFQALPSAAKHDSRDSIKIKQERKYSSYSS